MAGIERQVNRVGKFLYKNLDGADAIKFKSQMCEVYVTMYYQVPEEPDTFDELTFIISLTTYADKLRINITEDTSMQETILHKTYIEDQLGDLHKINEDILSKMRKAVSKKYAEYDFIY